MAREIKGGREKERERERESKGVCVRETERGVEERDPSVSEF